MKYICQKNKEEILVWRLEEMVSTSRVISFVVFEMFLMQNRLNSGK